MSDRHLLPRFEGDIISHHKWTIAVPKSDWMCTALSSLPVTVHHVNLLCINQWLGHFLLTNQYLCVLFLQDKQINSSEVKVKELTEQNTKLQRSHHSVQVGCRKKVPCLLLTGTKPLGTSSTVHVFIIWTDDY